MTITKVKAPKYRVGRYVLNEYELRTLMLEVAQGKQPSDIKVKCPQGIVATITEKGTLTNSISGLDLAGKLSLEVLKLIRIELEVNQVENAMNRGE